MASSAFIQSYVQQYHPSGRRPAIPHDQARAQATYNAQIAQAQAKPQAEPEVMAGTQPEGHPEWRLRSLHDVVLDYLNTQAYASTARALASPRPWKRPDAALEGSSSTNGITNGDAGESSTNGNDDSGKVAEETDTGGDVAMDDGDGERVGNGDGEGMSEGDEEGAGGFLSERSLVSIERRRAILNFVLNGAIMRAVESLNAHFPSVLAEHDPAEGGPTPTPQTSNGSITKNGHTPAAYGLHPSPIPPRLSTTPHYSLPPSLHIPPPPPPPLSELHSTPTLPLSLLPAHVHLNLSIQAFIEQVRQLAPASVPSSPSSSIGSLSSSLHLPSASGLALTNALNALQGLHQEAKKLVPADRAMYLKELNDVNGLLAYSEPENSIVRGFFEQGRRILLAEQVNRAILHSENRATQSKLEQTARRVSALWSTMLERKIDPTPSWTAADGAGKEELALYIRNNPRRAFSLREFVGHSTT